MTTEQHAALDETAGRRLSRTKIFAILSGGLVLGLGITATLASWSDSEWVFGGVDGTTPGIGTSAFEVEQNRGVAWDQHETADGGALTLTAPALALTPGDITYTHVSLRTTATTPVSIAGTLALSGAVVSATLPSDPSLWAALTLKVVVVAGTTTTCDASLFTAGATYVVGSFAVGAALNTAGTGTRPLSAAAGNQQNYCFQIQLPLGSPDTLQGKTVTPVWQFVGTSS